MEQVLAEGALQKHSPKKTLVKRWQTRHFILTPATLTYYKKRGGAASLGVIDLTEVRNVTLKGEEQRGHEGSGGGSGLFSPGKRAVFEVQVESGRVYVLAAESYDASRRWVQALRFAVGGASQSAMVFSAPPTRKQLGATDDVPLGDATDEAELVKSKPIQWSLMQNERVLIKNDRVLISYHSLSEGHWGQMHMTLYRFVFVTKTQCESVPLGLVMRVEPAKHEKRGLSGYLVSCKDFRTISLFFLNNEGLESISLLFKHVLFPTTIRSLYAFHNKESYPLKSEIKGWPLYDIEKEYKRQKLSSSKWRVTSVNENHALPHLPTRFIVPSSITDEMLGQLGEAQQKWQRWVMALCWNHSRSMARGCLLRSADSIFGLLSLGDDNRLREMVALGKRLSFSIVEHVLALYPDAQALHIFNTTYRKKLGTGVQDTLNTEVNGDTRTIQLRSTNLMSSPAVEESLIKLASLINSTDMSCFSPLPESDSEHSLKKLKAVWRESLDDTQWLKGVQNLLQEALNIIYLIMDGEPVLIQSVDGGGAVPQLTSLVQLCLDPYYRTIEGFCFLIEKEWMACAHKWGQQQKAKYQPKQYSHIFVQFIDAVWQLWDIDPSAFEFDCSLLLFLLESVYSTRFGSFLADKQRDRLKGKLLLSSNTVSVWSYIHANSKQFEHFMYSRVDVDSLISQPLLPQPERVKLWTGYYLRWACNLSSEKAQKLLLLQSIRDQKQNRSTEIDLSKQALHTIPTSIRDFPYITHLNLSHNFISYLPFSLATLSELVKLDLSHNLLATLPAHLLKSVPFMTRLEHINLSHNQLSDVSDLPSHDLPSLVHLDLSHNLLKAIPSHFAHLTQLKYLDLSRNQLDPGNKNQDIICLITTLTYLDLSGNSVPSLSPRIFSSLSQLEELALCNCKLTKLPMGIGQMTRLRVLRLSNNSNLRGLPSDLWTLSGLRELHARNCLGFGRESTIQTPEVGAGTGILPLNLPRRKRSTIKVMPYAPEKYLTGPDSLIFMLPAELGQLTELRYLDFSSNGITGIPPACFAKMNNLETLRLEGNSLSTLSIDLSGLSSLQELDLSHNTLNQLSPDVASLKQLTSLNLEGNCIGELPAQLSTLPLLAKLQVGPQNGHIRSPPQEIVALGSTSVLAYLTQLLHGQLPCHRMKLMFVGQENVGKTSLLRALRKDKRRTPVTAKPRLDHEPHTAPLSTDGIDINKWTMELPTTPQTTQIELSAWDFAGQEIYYVTHRFFLSERSLYMVVFNTLNLDQSYIEYWLYSISSSAGKSPVLLVGTHAEDESCSEQDINRVKWALLQSRCVERFPNVKGIHFVSCTTGKNMDQLHAQMQEIVASQEHIGQPLPSNYLEFEKLLLSKAKERVPPILSWSEYEALARHLCMIEKDQDLLSATSLLHNLGSIVHFAEDKLKDVVILDPQWLMNVMSTVVSTKHNYCRNGIMAHSALPQIWKLPDYPSEVHPFILSLLERFELSFPIGPHAHKLGDYPQTLRLGNTAAMGADAQDNDALYLIPTLLPEFQPSLLNSLWPSQPDWQESLFGRTYQFDFIPKGFLGRLIIRLLAFPLAARVYWRHGVLVQIGAEKVLLVLQPDNRQLTITVRTELKGEQMSNLSWLIFTAVETLISEWYNLTARVLIPCAHCLSRSLTNSPFMFPLEKCQQAATTPGAALLQCPRETTDWGSPKSVRLDHIAPDLAMVHLDKHKIEWSDLIKDEEKPIAQGGFASVYKGLYRGEPVAIKEIRSVDVDEFEMFGLSRDAESRRLTFEEFRHEVWIMSGLAHPNLLGMRGFCLQPPCIVTELVEAGSLFDFLSNPEKSKILDWPLRLKIAKDIAKGCACLHNTSPPMMHRDLKSPNILLADLSPNASVVAKLCDFGVSLSAEITAGRKVDCPVWLAPEILEKKAYTEKADVYSLGVIFWELLTQQPYFGEVKFMSTLEDLVKQGQRPPIPDSCIPSYRQLIQDCWANDPNQRPSSKEIVKRIETMMAGICPEAANYDANVMTEFQARRDAQLEERSRWQDKSRSKKDKMRAMQMVSIRSIVPADSKKQLITKSIKEMAIAPCSKNDIIEFMEEFLKLRKEALEEMDTDSADADTSENKVQEKAWIDQFLARLHEDKVGPARLDPLAPPSPTTAPLSGHPSSESGAERGEAIASSAETTIASDKPDEKAPATTDQPHASVNVEKAKPASIGDEQEEEERKAPASPIPPLLQQPSQGRVRSMGPDARMAAASAAPTTGLNRSRTSSGNEWRRSTRGGSGLSESSPLARRALLGQATGSSSSSASSSPSWTPSSSPQMMPEEDDLRETSPTLPDESVAKEPASRSANSSPSPSRAAGSPLSWSGVQLSKRPLSKISWSGSDDSEDASSSKEKETKKEKKKSSKSKKDKKKESAKEKKKKDKRKTKSSRKEKTVSKDEPTDESAGPGREQRSKTVAQMKQTLHNIEKDLDDVLAEFERELNS